MRNLVNGFGKMLSLAIRSATALGALILLALALVLTLDVLITRILDHPIPGIIKLSEAGLALILFLGLAVATRNCGHIRVDILVARLAPRTREFYDAIGYFFAAVFFALWTWQMGYSTAKSWAIREMATGLLPVPLYPVKFLLFLGLLIASIESIHLLVSSVHEICKPNASDIRG